MSKADDRANMENRAMRSALGLMGFDTKLLIQMMTDNEQARWMREIFGAVTIEIDAEKAQKAGASEKTIESMKVILNGLRRPEGSHD